MATTAEQAVHPPATPGSRALHPSPVAVRPRIAGAWTSMLFVFAYVDLFSLYRADVRAELAAGEIGGFAIGDPFLTAATLYVLAPSLLVVGTLVLRAAVARWLNIVLATVYALAVVGAAIGEMGYYLLGSAVEVVLLGGVVRWAWTWPRAGATTAEGEEPG